MCTQYLHHSHPLKPFPCHQPPTPTQDMFCPSIFQFCRIKKEKNGIFACYR
jgi:hypothetical protein